MKYLSKSQIDNRQFENNGVFDAKILLVDYTIKQTISDLIESIPFEDVKKLFNVTVEQLNHPNGPVTEITASLNINE